MRLRLKEMLLIRLDKLRDKPTSKLLVFQIRRDQNVNHHTDLLPTISSGDNQGEEEEDLEEEAGDGDLTELLREPGVELGATDG